MKIFIFLGYLALKVSALVRINTHPSDFSFSGCKCSQIQSQADCQDSNLFCLWENSKCSVKTCRQRTFEECSGKGIQRMFPDYDELTMCFPDAITKTCQKEADLTACDQVDLSQAAEAEDPAEANKICQSQFCNYNTEKKVCQDYKKSCYFTDEDSCNASFGGKGKQRVDQCVWLNGICMKQPVTASYNCEQWIYQDGCESNKRCEWNKTGHCQTIRCSNFPRQTCQQHAEISAITPTNVCKISFGQCNSFFAHELNAIDCQKRTQNTWAWDQVSQYCYPCVLIFLLQKIFCQSKALQMQWFKTQTELNEQTNQDEGVNMIEITASNLEIKPPSYSILLSMGLIFLFEL